MREILFRGKRLSDGAWFIGNLFVPDLDDAYTQICMGTPTIRISANIDPETVGQFTGLFDMDGMKIFEGDILQYCSTIDKELTGTPVIVTYGAHNCGCCHGVYGWTTYEVGTGYFSDLLGCYGPYEVDSEETAHLNAVKIIGNIHDNPELLK
jgi:uncharacterized phage protein (TIGR01671 family)